MSEIPKKIGYRYVVGQVVGQTDSFIVFKVGKLTPRIPIDQIAEVVENGDKIVGILIPEELAVKRGLARA